MSTATRLLAVTLLAAVAGTATFAAEAAPPHGPGMMGGPMMMMGGHGFEQLLDKVGASAEQRSQIHAIMKSAHDDLRTQHEAGRALHDQMLAAFTQPSVDARAVEALRQQQLKQHDQASQRMTQAMLDASRVLSADQRKRLGEQMAQRRAMMERHRSEREALDGKPAAR